MEQLNYLRIAQVLGGKLSRTVTPRFGGFSALRNASEQFRLLEEEDGESIIPRHLYPEVAAAFEQVRDGYELDRVLVDPELRKMLIDECHRRGVIVPDGAIFKRLQAFRKNESSGITLRPTTRRADIGVEGVYYAAELAYRQLNFVDTASVDQLLTDPETGAHFDELCAALAPHGTSLEFRWAALRLRKTRSLSKQKINTLLDIRPSAIELKLTSKVQLGDLNLDRVPEEQGLFTFTEQDGKPKYLYVGSAKSLREGIKPFQDAKPFALVGGEFWKPELDQITLRFAIIKNQWMGASARELGLRLIRDRHPLFNVPFDFKKVA